MPIRVNTFSIEQTQGSVSIASKWAHAVNTGKNLSGVLGDFQKLVGADVVQIVRQMHDFDRTRIVARNAEADGKLFSPSTRSFLTEVLGDVLHKTNGGALIFMTAALSDGDLRDNLEPCGLRDVGIVSLLNDGDFSDFLELHFRRSILDHDRILLQMLGPVLSRSWCDRAPGLAAALLAKKPYLTTRDGQSTHDNILSAANPAGLTRSEFRLCMLIQEGGLPDKVADALQISKSTFRSHLRSIYLKTGVSSHVELVHRLHRAMGVTAHGTGQKNVAR